MKNIVNIIFFLTILLVSQMLTTSCSSGQNSDRSAEKDESAYDLEAEEEQGDADEWHYFVLLKTTKPQPGEEHLYDGTPVFAGLSLVNASGDFFVFDDEVDYASVARQLLFAYKLADGASFSTSEEWNKFARNVLDKTIYAPYSASCLDEINDSQWREKAKKLWYDTCREIPISYGERRYGKQIFRYKMFLDYLLKVEKADTENKFDLPEGAIQITSGII